MAGHSIPELGHFWRGVCQKGIRVFQKVNVVAAAFFVHPQPCVLFRQLSNEHNTYTYKACMYLPTDPISHSESD